MRGYDVRHECEDCAMIAKCLICFVSARWRGYLW